MIRAAITALLLAVTPAAHPAEWRMTEQTDSMTDIKTVSVMFYLESGEWFSIARLADKRIWGIFRAESLGTRFPMIRVDKLTAVDVDRNRTSELAWARSTVKRLSQSMAFVVFHGEGPADRGTLRDIMDGEELRIRYFTATNKPVEVTIPLRGAKPLIAKAFNIPEEADQERAAATEQRFQQRKAALDACDQLKPDIKRVLACYESNRTKE